MRSTGRNLDRGHARASAWWALTSASDGDCHAHRLRALPRPSWHRQCAYMRPAPLDYEARRVLLDADQRASSAMAQRRPLEARRPGVRGGSAPGQSRWIFRCAKLGDMAADPNRTQQQGCVYDQHKQEHYRPSSFVAKFRIRNLRSWFAPMVARVGVLMHPGHGPLCRGSHGDSCTALTWINRWRAGEISGWVIQQPMGTRNQRSACDAVFATFRLTSGGRRPSRASSWSRRPRSGRLLAFSREGLRFRVVYGGTAARRNDLPLIMALALKLDRTVAFHNYGHVG